MRNSARSLATTIFGILIMLAAPTAYSGQFYLTYFGASERSDYGTSALMGASSTAKFQGSVEWDDDNWQISAGIRPAFDQWHDGTPETGANDITEGMIVSCSSSSCGGSAVMDKCTSSGTNNAYTYRGAVAISHNISGTRIDSRVKVGSTECVPLGGETVPEGSDEPLVDGCEPVP